jgi:hypothetical protein
MCLHKKKLQNTGVQSINNVFHIDNEVDDVSVFIHFNVIDNVEYVVYALYSRIVLSKKSFFT